MSIFKIIQKKNGHLQDIGQPKNYKW